VQSLAISEERKLPCHLWAQFSLIFKHHKLISTASQATWCLIWVMIELLYYALELGGLKFNWRQEERERQLRCWVCLTEILLWREKRGREFVVHCFCLCRRPCLRILLFVWEFSFVFSFPASASLPFSRSDCFDHAGLWSSAREKKKREKKEGGSRSHRKFRLQLRAMQLLANCKSA